MLFQLENATSIANNIKQQIHCRTAFSELRYSLAQFITSSNECSENNLEHRGQIEAWFFIIFSHIFMSIYEVQKILQSTKNEVSGCNRE